MTKDQLIAENATLKAEIERLKTRAANIAEEGEASDRDIRKELSKALGAGTWRKNTYDDYQQTVYSWFEIFREIGKLIERKKDADLTDAVSHLSDRMNDLQERIADIDGPSPR